MVDTVQATPRSKAKLEQFAAVRLTESHAEGDHVFPRGTRGVIVDCYEDGSFGVEVSTPIEDVVIVKQGSLEAI